MAIGIGLKSPLPFLQNGPTTGFKPTSAVILGGSSAVGAATIQILRLAVPECMILTTSSPTHHPHLTDTLGADHTFDRDSVSLIDDLKSRTSQCRGVDAIVDVVGAGSVQKDIFDVLNPDGPKKYAQVWTGNKEIEAPPGVDSVMFRGRDLPQLPGKENIMHALQCLLEDGKYQLPLPVHVVGHGLDALERGLEMMRHGVSGTKLVVTI